MIHIPDFPRLLKRGFARAGASPLASGSWEALRTILVVAVWTLGLALAGILVNVALFVASLPEILHLADAGADAVQGGGVLAILLQLVLLLFLVFTSPSALALSVVYLAVFPVMWAWIGLRHGWALSLQRWEGAVRRQVAELARTVAQSAPEEAVEALRATSRGMGEAFDRMIAVRDRSGLLVRWLSRGPMKVVQQLKAMLHEIPGHESALAAERMLEQFGSRLRFALPSAVLWGVLVNALWFAIVKLVF